MKDKKAVCTILILCICLSCIPVSAEPPTVSIDEAVYVNLDYYGAVMDTSIVKGCSLNGITSFEDFGVYEKVTNMSNYVKPELTENSVRWNLPSSDGRFYFECKPKDNAVQMPWTFNISYKLNGVPAEAKSLAGASGLIEINIECIPNENADDYYKNNLLLQVASMVDMQDTLSMEAPGAQLQSMGTYKAVVFAALPGEHTTFTMRIGTNHFESSGIVMMMIPGTLEQMKQIKQIKEAKDTIGDSADAIYDSLDSILGILSASSSGISSTQRGLASLDTARGLMSSSKDGIYDSADAAIADLSDLSAQLVTLIPHLQNGQQLIGDVNTHVNNLVSDLTHIKSDITSYQTSISNIQTDIADYQRILKDFNSTKEDRKDITDRLNQDIVNLDSALSNLGEHTGRMRDNLRELRHALERLQTLIRPIPLPSSFSQPQNSGSLDSIIENIGGALQQLNDKINSAISDIKQQIRDINNYVNRFIDHTDEVLDKLNDFLASTENTLNAVDKLCTRGQELSGTLQKALDLGETYFSLLGSGYASTDELLSEMNNVGDTAQNSLDTVNEIIGDVEGLNGTLNQYEQDMKSMLGDTANITSDLSGSLSSMTGFFTSLKNVLQQSSSSLDSGTQQTLNGLIDVLQKGLEGVNTTGKIQNANRTVKNAVDEQVDKYENENNLLNLDAETKMISFTSKDNPQPASIQIILRTEEIDEDSVTDTSDLEGNPENLGFWKRVANVFIKIWESVTAIFK